MYVYMCVHVCVYMCMCICMHICVSVYMYTYTCIYTRVWVYICTHVGVLCLFVLSNPSTTYMRVYHMCFNNCMRVWWGIGSGDFFSLFMVGANFWRGRLCFDRGRDRDFALHISLFFLVSG